MEGPPKGFAAGRGHLAATAAALESLSFGMNELRPVRPMGGGGVVGMGGDREGEGGDDREGGALMPRGGHLGGTMKLFASLGLSPSDLDVLAQIPEEDISVETLPQILLQLKKRKAGRGPSSGWDDGGRMGGGGSSFSQASGSSDFGFASAGRAAAGLNFGGGRERSYGELSHRDSYGAPQGGSLSQAAFSQRRKGSPSLGKVQDFLGAPPPRFPHVCSLCDFDVHSNLEWSQHTNGLRHAENRRVLVTMYPEWDIGGVPGRSGIMESTNLSAGLLGPAPSGPAPAPRMASGWGSGAGLGLGMSRQNHSEANVLRSRVVVVKYDRKPLSVKTLFSFAEPFGRLQEHLVLKTKAFLEMETHEEAMDMVNYYQQNPAMLYGKSITFYLSRRLIVIQKEERASDRASWDGPRRSSQVVFFSNLPREEDKKKELLTVAARFGVVEKHLFLTDQAFIQLGRPEDAEMMVKYHTLNPLTIKGRAVRLNICTKYKTLNINRRQKEAGGGSAWTAATKRRSSRSCSPSGSRDGEGGAKSASEGEPADDDEGVAGVREAEEGRSAAGADQDDEPGEPPGGGRDGAQYEARDDHGDGGAEDGGAEDGGAEDGGAEDGGAEDGGAEDGGADETPADADGAGRRGPEEESEERPTEAASGVERATAEGDDFLENMEDFVTLDELPEEDEKKEAADEGPSDGTDTSRKGGLRVVNVLGFRRGYKFLDELLGLATPFGKVVKHLVLDWRPEAFLQFGTEEEARAMVKFYNGNVTPSVCGRPVRVNHSLTYPTIQCGASRVVYVGQLPNSTFEDEDVLKLAEPFGKVKKYFLNPIKRECFLEMEKAEAADQMAQAYKTNQAKLKGRRLLIYVSRKYTQLKYGHSCPSTTKRGPSSSSPKSSKPSDEPPAKKIKQNEEHRGEMEEPKEEVKRQDEEEQPKAAEEEEEEPKAAKEEEEEPKAAKEEEVEQPRPQPEKVKEEDDDDDEEEKLEDEQKKPEDGEERMEPREEEGKPSSDLKMEADAPEKIPNVPDGQPTEEEPSADGNRAGPAPPAAAASLPLPPFEPDRAIGVEHIKMGYYCRVCLLFYSNEDTAKKTHCSSRTHYDKLQKHLEKEGSGAEKKRAKKTSS